MQRIYRFFLSILSILLLLQACAPSIERSERPSDSALAIELQQQIDRLTEAGNFKAAAELAESQANIRDTPLRESLLIQAAQLWLRAGDNAKAEQLAQLLSKSTIPDELHQDLRMLKAELAIRRQDLGLALDLLQPPPGPDSSLQLRQRYHRNMAEIFRLNGNLLESARELVELDKLLQGSEAQLENQQQLVSTLSSMTDAALSLLQPKPPGELGGWMDLVRILKRRSEDIANFEAHLSAWQEQFPGHSALPELLTGFIEQQLLDQSRHIAILLPRSGTYARVAASLRDGFMAAWYQLPVERRPDLRFYDSSDPERIQEHYQQAVLQGAHLVVGPLNKQAVKGLIELADLPVPVLALNEVDQTTVHNPNLFQFGLSPEDEAEQAAERAWLEGYTTALALTPRDDWGYRLYRSFRNRWETLGGSLLEHQTYDARKNDYSRPIRLLLNIDESEARKQSLQRIIGVPMETEPRRREDANFIFLAARAQQGRQLRPQLKFHHAGDLPVFATSHIYNSVADVDKDKDLGHIKFVDTPWLLESDSHSQLSRENLKRLIPGVQGNYARLYAMGIDAFNLLSHLEAPRDQAGYIMNGKTGNLYLDGFNRVHRQLAWADIESGQAKITGYAPRLEQPISPYTGRGVHQQQTPFGNPDEVINSSGKSQLAPPTATPR